MYTYGKLKEIFILTAKTIKIFPLTSHTAFPISADMRAARAGLRSRNN
jgi:hypothetical protein